MDATEFQAAIEAVDLTATDARAQILALNEGLMNSNNTLLTESKANKTAAQESAEAKEASDLAAINAEKLRLEQANDMDGVKKIHAKEMADALAKEQLLTKSAKDALNQRDKGEVVNSILSSVDDRYKAFVKTQLDSAVSISYGEDGKAVTSIKEGDAQYASPTDFLSGVAESDTWKHVLKATSMSGANTKQSTGDVSQQTGNSVQSNLAERLKAQGLTQ